MSNRSKKEGGWLAALERQQPTDSRSEIKTVASANATDATADAPVATSEHPAVAEEVAEDDWNAVGNSEGSAAIDVADLHKEPAFLESDADREHAASLSPMVQPTGESNDFDSSDIPDTEPEWLRLGLAKSLDANHQPLDLSDLEDFDSEAESCDYRSADSHEHSQSQTATPDTTATNRTSGNGETLNYRGTVFQWIPADDFAPANLVDSRDEPQPTFIPEEPADLEASGLTTPVVERLIFRYLLQRTNGTGREIADLIRLPFRIVEPILNQLRQQRFIAYKSNVAMADYLYELTEQGHTRARRESENTTYSGAAPVAFADYIAGVQAQGLNGCRVGVGDLCTAFDGLQVSPKLLQQIGQAVNSGEGLFLYGAPGNGKTSLAERIAQAFGTGIWIPRALLVSGQIVRLFDSSNHVPQEPTHLPENFNPDRRWIYIKRPSIVVGGELTLDDLEVHFNPTTGVSEAPLHIKANGGVMVIDDFGRQRVRPSELLNRWIVPLEKRYDFFTLQSGQQVKVPFEQVVVFSTNLEPSELVDEAFLRRIPYKVEVTDPDPLAFRDVLRDQARKLGFGYSDAVARYLIETHYIQAGRPLRFCHPRDLLLQIRNLCRFRDLSMEMTEERFDLAVANYFGNLGMGQGN